MSKKEFVNFNKEEFEGVISSIIKKSHLNSDFYTGKVIVEIPKNTKEYVYRIETQIKNIEIIIYSSVCIYTNVSRNIGKDAIRCIVSYKGKKIFLKEKRINRIETWVENLNKRLNKIAEELEIVPICPNCGERMIERENKQNKGKTFWGCSSYPTCKGIRNK